MSQRPYQPEVLAPAGSRPALLAALWNGADAVYFGLAEGFNARARAANFSLAELPELVARIHRAGARAYVTMNTLVFEPELPALERVLRGIAASGVDALIVQDPAVCLLARAVCPELELHASTQMTIAEPGAVPFAAALGVSRVVVPRELSVQEIEAFAAGTDLELEVFVHGALCVSWSGQCLTSEAWGGRSANRGQCAQSCRMPYELVVDGKVRPLGDVQYLLSPKDLSGARAMPELLRIGVHGLKIEGRQKGPQYVATATAGYRRWVDALRGDALHDAAERKAAERQLANDLLAMSLSYTRGFSDGFLGGSDHQTLVEGRFPKHRGVFVGRVRKMVGDRVVVGPDPQGRPWTGALATKQRPSGPTGERSAPLPAAGDAASIEVRPGMGVVFDQGNPEDKHEPGGALWFVDARGDELWLGFGRGTIDLSAVRPGDRVFVTNDPTLTSGLAPEDQEPTGRNAVDLVVAGALGEPLRVVATCKGWRADAQSAMALQTARGAGLDAALLADKLGAFGGTPFALGAIDVAGLAAGLHVPAGELKELRRRLVAELLPQLERGPVRTVAATPQLERVRGAGLERIATAPGVPTAAHVVPLVRSDEQLEAALAAGAREVELDWMEFVGLGKAVERARQAGVQVTVATTRIGKPGEEPLLDRIKRLEPDGVLVRHFGALMRCLQWRRDGMQVALHGDFSLNAANSLTAAHLLGMGLATITASFDLDEDQLFAMLKHLPGERVAVVAQHRIPTFHTEHCVYAHLLSNGRDYRSCGRPCERHQVALKDHTGREHPVIVDVGCRNTVFHHAPQQSSRWTQRLLGSGVRRFRVEFVRETGAQVRTALAAFGELLAGRCGPDDVVAKTGAISRFGVAEGGMKLLVE